MNFRSAVGSLAAGLLWAGSLSALTPNEWRFSQAVDVPAQGLIQLQLPPETLDVAQPDLQDLRILDSAGGEVPYLIDQPMPRVLSAVRPQELLTELQTGVFDSAQIATLITLTTGTKSVLKGVILETPPGAEFIKAVRVEGSPDGKKWQQLTNGQPIFRMAGGASNLRVSFPENAWAFLRLTIDDSRATAVPFTGVQLEVVEASAPPQPFPVTIKSRDESFGKTRLSIDLGASNMTIALLRIDTVDPLFARAVTIAVPDLADDTIREQELRTGSIYRVDLNGKVETRLEIPIEMQIRSRELIVLIDNGDSPPLAIKSVQGERRVTTLVFLAREPSRYVLLSGNNQCAAPRYDLPGLTEQLKTAAAKDLQPSSLTANPGYKAPDDLAAVPLEGAKIDLTGWKFRKPISLRKPGAQQLELDPDVLAHCAPDQRDVRIVMEDRQVPFLLERTSISRSIALSVTPVKDPKKPRVSRWLLKMPQAGVPITRLACSAGSALFQRDMWLSEEVADERGDKFSHDLGRARWQRVPNQPATEFAIPVEVTPKSDTLFLETDNGDNPAIELRDFRVFYAVTRVVFKTGSDSTLSLYYGNPNVVPPRYDVSLIADQLLRAERGSAILGAQGGSGSTTERITQTLGGFARYIFWGVLALVVIGLLVLISRLLPKAQNPDV